MIHPFNTSRIYCNLKKSWEDQPLVVIMAMAVLLRLLAAIFAKGYGMMDDHFLVIEAPQSWVYGYDYDSWLPGSKDNFGPSGHNFFYPGINFLLFTLMKWMHIYDPQVKMLILRFSLGAFSLLTVWYGYRIVETLSDKRSATLAGSLLALCFFMPWAGVRNLVEVICIPFLMMGFWQIVKARNTSGIFRTWFMAGLFFGLATDFRYQAVLFPAGVFIVMLFRFKWKEMAGIVAGVICSFLLVQTMIDLIIWGYPFAEFMGYIKVNITDRNSYFNLPWYNYFLTVGGIMIPPLSLFLFYGFIRGWKRYWLLFFPAALFFAFHSYFPNKQERFILPFIPFFIMVGVMGYYQYIAPSGFWTRHQKLLRSCWMFFWVVNLLLLAGLTFMYSKRAQVESMYYLSKYPYVKNLIIEDEKGEVPMPPLFYTEKWPSYPEIHPPDTTVYQLVASIAAQPKFYHPQFILFSGDKNLQNRVILVRKNFPLLVYETTIEPAFVDKLMHRLNKVNKANNIYIYRNREFYKTRRD